MSTPTVSIVMSVYNGERYLKLAVESILAQTWTDFEFIIIDDGSTDRSGQILTAYAAQDSRLVLLSNPANRGYTASLNRGVEAARGEFVARQDADDVSLPERLAQQVATLRAQPGVGVVGTLAQVIDADGCPQAGDYFPRALDNAAVQEQLLAGNCICHGSVLIRRHLLDDVGAYDVSLEPSEDYDLWLRLAEKGEIINLEPRLYQYRVHGQSVSQTRRPAQALGRARALERAVQRRHGPRPATIHAQTVALRYLDAALAAFAAGQPQPAANWLEHAFHWQPRLLQAEAPLAELLIDYAAQRSPQAGDQFLREVFANLLPPTASLARLRRRLLSDLHMRQVFAGVRSKAFPRVDAHLWPALRHDPAWLLNRGVLSILTRSLVRRGRGLVQRR